MTKIMMNPADIEVIQNIIRENQITGNFELSYENASGIGYTIDMSYVSMVNGREAKITIPVCGVDTW